VLNPPLDELAKTVQTHQMQFARLFDQIRVPPTMNDMEAKFMLVEMRLRLSGKLGGNEKKQRPDTFSSKFEEAMWTKPAFNAFYSKLKANGDPNAMNVVTEYLNVSTRYGWLLLFSIAVSVTLFCWIRNCKGNNDSTNSIVLPLEITYLSETRHSNAAIWQGL